MADTFHDYKAFIYLNTHLTKESAHKCAVWCWEHGLDKYDALKKARQIKPDTVSDAQNKAH